jgi:predicted O-methyltransferase YrrM
MSLQQRVHQAKKYLKHQIEAVGPHGVHSPFVYELITQVLVDQNQFYAFAKLADFRESLLSDSTPIPTLDYGAGSVAGQSKSSTVSQIASVAGQTDQGVKQIFRLAHRLGVTSVLELGTSVGISTAAFGFLGENVSVHSIEGNPDLAAYAESRLRNLGLTNVHVHAGTFQEKLDQVIHAFGPFDMVYIDGNHRKEPTLEYWSKALKQLPEKGFVIFDDIHWSSEMSEAWSEIQADEHVTLSLDFYRFGVAFIDSSFSKEQFQLRVKV